MPFLRLNKSFLVFIFFFIGKENIMRCSFGVLLQLPSWKYILDLIPVLKKEENNKGRSIKEGKHVS